MNNTQMHKLGKLSKLSLLAPVFCSLISSAHADLIGHWKFDEGEGAVAADCSEAGNDGDILGATWGSDAVFANHLVFDGTDDLVDPLVTLPVMTMTNDFTWAVWVNSALDPDDPDQRDAVIIGNRVALTGDDSTPRQFIKLTPTNFEWHQNDNGNDNIDVENVVMGEWHHVAVVKTGEELEHFFDGVSIGTQTLSQAPGSEENPFVIGGHARPNNSTREFFNGSIADVRIYDEALSAADVLAVYAENAPSGPSELEITDITRNTAGDIDLVWASIPERDYTVEISTGLTEAGQPGGWEVLVDAIESGGASSNFTILSSFLPEEDRLFFRVVLEPEPVEE